jgi:hypothetical protein
VASYGNIVTAEHGDAQNREENRDPKNHKTIHVSSSQCHWYL